MVCSTHLTFVFLWNVTIQKKKKRESSNFQSVGRCLNAWISADDWSANIDKTLAARSWVSDLSFFLPHIDDNEGGKTNGSEPQDLVLSFGELDSWWTWFLVLVESWSICQALWSRLWVLLLMFSIQRELMLKGTLAVPSVPVLKCQFKKGRAEGRGMPYKS